MAHGPIVRDQRGSSAVEFALVFPLMLTMLFGILQFGLTLNNNVTLTDAARAGVRELAIGRSSATAYNDAVNRFYGSAPGLVQANTTLTMTVNGVGCSSNATCQAALVAATGLPVKLVARYPCDLKVMAIDFAPGCTLVTSTTQRVE